jgi:hypothetical protein
MKEVDLAWMAGILDLKGRTSYKNNKQRSTRQVVMLVDSQELAVVRRMAQLTGTAPEAKAAKEIKDWWRTGCREHCPEAHVHIDLRYPSGTLPAIGRWSITGAGMVVVYRNLRPHITIDRYEEAVNEADMFVALDSNGSGMVLASLRRLRNLGWNLPDRYSRALDDRDQRLETGVGHI